MDLRTEYTVPDVAVMTGLPIPKVRYYAHLYGDFLGATCSPFGDWTFRAEHLPFFRALAQGLPPATALKAVVDPAFTLPGPPVGHTDGYAAGNVQRDCGGDVQRHPATGSQRHPPADAYHTSGADDPSSGHLAEKPAPARPPLTAPVRDLDERLDELTLQVQDLCEETKQVQILLSQVIGLLQAHAATGPVDAAGEAGPAGAASALGPTAPPGAGGTRGSGLLRQQPSYQKWEPGALSNSP